MRNIILTMLLLATIHVARAQVLSGEQPAMNFGFLGAKASRTNGRVATA